MKGGKMITIKALLNKLSKKYPNSELISIEKRYHIYNHRKDESVLESYHLYIADVYCKEHKTYNDLIKQVRRLTK